MARRKRKRTAGRRRSDRMPGWMGMMTGLVIGLTVAFFVYISELKPPAQLKSSVQEQKQAAIKAVDKAGQSIGDAVEDATEDKVITFDFYDMLPNLDVDVYEDDPPARVVTRSAPPTRASTPGIYILQAGSFSKVEDANRRKAEMALLGVRSEIKRGNANDRTVYRVYTSPMDSPDEVNRVSDTLRNSNIEILLKRVSD
jgi:cell division protein FtsN